MINSCAVSSMAMVLRMMIVCENSAELLVDAAKCQEKFENIKLASLKKAK